MRKKKNPPSSKTQIKILSPSGCSGDKEVPRSPYQQSCDDLAAALKDFKDAVDNAYRVSEFLIKCFKFLNKIINKSICLFKGHRYMSSLETETEIGEGFIYPPRRFLIEICERCGKLKATEILPKLHENCRCVMIPVIKKRKKHAKANR